MVQTTLSGKKLDTFVRLKVLEAVQELLQDPDYGLAVRRTFQKRLGRSLREKKRGAVYSLETVKQKYAYRQGVLGLS
jgi:hypothetical protein